MVEEEEDERFLRILKMVTYESGIFIAEAMGLGFDSVQPILFLRFLDF